MKVDKTANQFLPQMFTIHLQTLLQFRRSYSNSRIAGSSNDSKWIHANQKIFE